MFLCSLCLNTDTVLEYNRRLYVREDNMWSVKGRYDGLEDHETAQWEVLEGNLTLPLLMVCLFTFECSILLMVHPGY
jgi:hypothetical protein